MLRILPTLLGKKLWLGMLRAERRRMNPDHVAAMRSTAAHIRRVQELLVSVSRELLLRGVHHDGTKWGEHEWPYFAEATHLLADVEYGSDAYRAGLDQIRPGVERHQKTHRHHPECHPRGVLDMHLIDLVEMLADWKAAGERTKGGGDLALSIRINVKRFQIPRAIADQLRATAVALGWCHDFQWED